MPGLRIYTSNRMEILARELARGVRKPLASALTPETIVVQSQGMARWISMELARHNGVCANCFFPFPNAFWENVFKRTLPEMPAVSLFEPEVMAFKLMTILPKCLRQDGFESLKTYLENDRYQLKLFQLACKIADLFDQYLIFRPEMIFQWEKGQEQKTPPHAWQAALWRELVRQPESVHRARLRQDFLKKINTVAFDPQNLPERVSLFGISFLPFFHLEAFAELSRLIEINMFLLNPCREYWADIVSEQELQKFGRKHPQVAENVEWFHFVKGNRLLAALGALGRDFFGLISGFDCEIDEQFQEPQASTMLTCIQSDILNLRDREAFTQAASTTTRTAGGLDLPASGGFTARGAKRQGREVPQSLRVKPAAGQSVWKTQSGDFASAGHRSLDSPGAPFGVNAPDKSIQVHSCHSPMREIEVLHDQLLAMFEEDPDLLPKDIIVMAPDIETYAPYIQAVFDAQPDSELRIPFSIADQSPRRENRVAEGFLALLELVESRFGAAQVVRLLEFPGIKEAFGLIESDLRMIERWIQETRIRWGRDQDDRRQFGLPGFSENTWRAGLERLLLGYAMPGENQCMFDGILPFDYIEGTEVKILGRFLEFTDRLFAWAKHLKQSRKLGEWQSELLAFLDQFFRSDETIEHEIQFLRRLLDDLAEKESASGFVDKIELAVIRSYLQSRLGKSSHASGFLTGGVTFCAMLPMRSIPFQVICMIGMNSDAFPRVYHPLNFDLIARHPRPGDRSRRNDDKYLFLESIMSARKRLYISYVGQSIQDNSTMPPSVLVSELLDTIAKSFVITGENIAPQIVTHHRLQAFSRWYFREGTGLFSYSRENMLAGARSGNPADPPPFVSGEIPMTPAEKLEWQSIDLDDLCRFFQNPARFFLLRRLGLRLEAAAPLADERESFDLKALDRYQVEQNLLTGRLSGVDLDNFKPIQKAMGQLPHGNVGEYHYGEIGIEVDAFARKIERFISAAPKKPLEVDLKISEFQLHGRLSGMYEPGYVRLRYARRRSTDLINAWIYHLAFCLVAAGDYPSNSFLLCKDTAVQFVRAPDSHRILADLCGLFQRGLTQPIHFFPNASFEYADQVLRRSQPEASAAAKARNKWAGNQFADPAMIESRDPHYDLCFRRQDPIDATFKEIAVSVFKPLLAHCREIVL